MDMSEPPTWRWSVLLRVERSDNRLQCDVRAALDFIDPPSYEISVSHHGNVLYARMFPTQETAQRQANDELRELLDSGWVKT